MALNPKLIKTKTIKTSLSLRTLVCYIILVPFLHPKGFDEYFPLYKMFFTAWLYGSMALIIAIFLADFCKESERYKKCLVFMMVYYIVSVVITLIVQRGLGAGLQKMFAAPALGMLCGYYLKHNCKMFLNCLCNLVLIVLGLTVLIFNPLFFGQYFRDEIHLMFIGHVQIGAQFGMLGILLAFLLSQVDGWTIRLKLLVVLAISAMIMSLTSASMLSLAIIFMGLIYRQVSKSKKLLLLKPGAYLLSYLAMNSGLFGILMLNNWFLPFDFLSLNGRNFIWKEGFSQFLDHPIIGYGVHGALIRVFWSKWIKGGADGMNYAHNQMLQVMLDGGVILLVCFLLMILFYMKAIECAPQKVRTFANVCLIAILVIMTVESTFEYHYIVLIFSLLAYSREICQCKPLERIIQEDF